MQTEVYFSPPRCFSHMNTVDGSRRAHSNTLLKAQRGHCVCQEPLLTSPSLYVSALAGDDEILNHLGLVALTVTGFR